MESLLIFQHVGKLKFNPASQAASRGGEEASAEHVLSWWNPCMLGGRAAPARRRRRPHLLGSGEERHTLGML